MGLDDRPCLLELWFRWWNTGSASLPHGHDSILVEEEQTIAGKSHGCVLRCNPILRCQLLRPDGCVAIVRHRSFYRTYVPIADAAYQAAADTNTGVYGRHR